MLMCQAKIFTFLVVRLVVKAENFLFLSSRGKRGSHIPTAKIALTARLPWFLLLRKNGFCGRNKAIERFEAHHKTNYHRQATLKGDDFLNIMHGNKDALDKCIDKSRSISGAENREILKPVIDTIIFCERQNIPLRAIAIMLRRHFESCGRNVTYISWNIQNHIAEACNDIFTSKIVGEVNSAKCFSLLKDETTYISCSEQFTFCLRYVKHDSNRGYSLQESFLQFLPVEATTGKNVADTFIRALQERGINCYFLRDQGYDELHP
ncbi:hypothetical protein PR048_027558 [Dryococelus australis]|uniref:Uncharacterized protein n=1 Tax=Dryococelus australis TaxID=614101 RepID=A0ABQ9GGV7_9NEOP|nr:hypothetical protein PR048_027558 [Dryococelus australis]